MLISAPTVSVPVSVLRQSHRPDEDGVARGGQHLRETSHLVPGRPGITLELPGIEALGGGPRLLETGGGARDEIAVDPPFRAENPEHAEQEREISPVCTGNQVSEIFVPKSADSGTEGTQ